MRSTRWARLQAAGLYTDAMSFDQVDRVAVAVNLRDVHARPRPEIDRRVPAIKRLSVRRRPAPRGPRRPAARHLGSHHLARRERRIVGNWPRIPEVKAYTGGAFVSRPRHLGRRRSPARRRASRCRCEADSTYKPTIFITGRQHANEVSSTSHILRLAELLVTDTEYRDILKKVNVILHPVENPDGAQMAYDLRS